MSYQCAKCAQGCNDGDLSKARPDCPSRKREEQEKIAELYKQEENFRIAHNAALVEKEGYCKRTRIQEIMDFCDKMGYHKVGLLFCTGLKREALEVTKIFEHHGLEVVSVVCKNGIHPKSMIGLSDDQTIRGCSEEVMCNPIGQAMLMNEEKTDFNVMLGLCVGHDTLALKYLEAPVTILAVKDRVTGHNPLAPVYLAQSYYQKKLYEEG